MKRSIKTGIMTLAMFSVFSIPVFGLTQTGNGTATNYEYDGYLKNHTVGVKKLYDSKDTYGYSWVDPDDNRIYCFSRVTVGSVSSGEAKGMGYAQTNQVKQNGNYNVSETHGLAK